MKKTAVAGLFLCLLSTTALAQKQPKKAAAPPKKTAFAKRSKPVTVPADSATLVSSGDYTAAAPDTLLRIADPTVRTFNLRAAGAGVPAGQSAIIGMPKGSYGFANGRIFFRKTTASSGGTGHGSGAVGTGTSIHGAGTGESTLGVNGKSPDAGIGLWGDKQRAKPVTQKPASDKKEN